MPSGSTLAQPTGRPIEEIMGGLKKSVTAQIHPKELIVRQVKNGWVISTEQCYNNPNLIEVATSVQDINIAVGLWAKKPEEI